jgi:hypothetical protein
MHARPTTCVRVTQYTLSLALKLLRVRTEHARGTSETEHREAGFDSLDTRRQLNHFLRSVPPKLLLSLHPCPRTHTRCKHRRQQILS